MRGRVEGEAEQIQGDELGCKEREKERKHRVKGKRRRPGPHEEKKKKMTRLRSPRGWIMEEAVIPDVEENIRNGMKPTCRKSQEEGKESN